MNRPIFVACCLLLAVPSAILAQSEPRDAVQYDIFIACPSTTNNQCPIQAWDSADALGSPAIVVDPDDVNNMIFASLHNGAASAPEERSRAFQPFTTHTSQDHGASWQDNPYSPPTDIPAGATGEHPGIALDPYGHVFISSLYAVPAETDNGTEWDYIIAAQKFGSLADINTYQNGQYNVDYVDSVHVGNRIGQTWFAYDPLSDNVVLLWNEQPLRPVTQAAPSNGTNDTSPVAQAKALVERFLPPPPATSAGQGMQGTGKVAVRSTISWVWTSADVSDPYNSAATNVIAPCATSTNPVVSEGWLYVGCVVADEGAPDWAPNAQPGEIHMFRFLPNGGEPQYIGRAPVDGGSPKLGVRSDGRMALMTTEVLRTNNASRIRLDGTYGQYDTASRQVVWGDVHAYGDDLQIIYANMPLSETNIQDMLYREYSGVIHMVFKRVANWPASYEGHAYRPEFFKAIVAIDEHYGVLEEIDLRIGDEALRLKDGSLNGQPASLYNDLSDDFLELPPAPFEYKNRPLGDAYQREFYAVGNYGFVDFAELIEVTELRGPAAVGLPDPPPPPTPSPATSSSLALGLAGSLTASAIVAGTAASNKRKSLVRAGRKKKT